MRGFFQRLPPVHSPASLLWRRARFHIASELLGPSLALFRSEQGRLDEAREVLARVYERFTEGLESCDLKVAKRILDDLAHPDTRLD